MKRRTILKALGVASLSGVATDTATANNGRGGGPDNPGNGRGPPQFDPIEATVEDVLQAIKTRQTTAEEITETYLDRIEAYDDDLNSIITVNDEAVDRAKELDETFEDEGFVGPLHGVPLILKDLYDTGDLPTTGGSVALENSVPPDDAFLVAQLRAAGAVVIAKANLHEFAFGITTVSSLGGQTRNAYDLDRVPSGSSGGSAAAIAANLGVIGTGSDTCSSNRSPPAFNNEVGLRSTRGLLSRDGLIPLSETQDTGGPITRTVVDTAVMMDVMAGYDPADPVTAKSVGNVPEEGYVSYLNEDGLEGARIGVARTFFGIQGDSEGLPVDEEDAAAVTEVIDTAIDDMAAAGAEIVDPVPFEEAREYTRQGGAIFFEFKRDLNAYLDSLGEDAPVESLGEIIEKGLYFPESFRSDEFDADELGGSVEGNIKAAQTIDVEGLDENVDYLQQLNNRVELKETTLSIMADHNLDAVLYPTSTVPPVEIGKDQPFSQMNCQLSAYSGLPAITVPAGFTAENDLPVGVELLGREFAEPELIELAYAYEQATQNRQPPDDFGQLEDTDDTPGDGRGRS